MATMIEESTYRASCIIPDSQWVNSRIWAPLAVVGAHRAAHHDPRLTATRVAKTTFVKLKL
jgi:hypothetical protein